DAVERRAVARAQLRAERQEEGHVRPERCRERMQLIVRQRVVERLVGDPESGCRVRAAAAEAGGDRDPLLDRRLPPGLDAGGARRKAPERAPEDVGDDRRMIAVRRHRDVDPLPVRARDLDVVVEIDALEHGDDLVLAVVARRADDERQVDLRVGPHASAAASATNSSGASSSARTFASRPIAPSATTAGSRVTTELSAGELASVLRRWANAASTTRFTPAGTEASRRRNATSAESTFGRGRNTSRETAWKPVRSATSCTSTETAPYAFVPCCAKKRSATSRCTITHQESTVGARSRLSTTSGVAML